MTSSIDKTKPYFPLAGGANDGWSNDDEATATCFCGAVQLSLPLNAPGLITSFICNCADCHKITASMSTTGLVVRDTHLTHIRGRENLSTYSQSKTIFMKPTDPDGKPKDNTVTNHFCKTCGSLMYRVGASFPGISVLRLGTVDDFSLHEGKLRPRVEIFEKDRVGWRGGVEGVQGFWNDGLHP